MDPAWAKATLDNLKALAPVPDDVGHGNADVIVAGGGGRGRRATDGVRDSTLSESTSRLGTHMISQ